MSEMKSALSTIRSFQQEAREKATRLMEEAIKLETYAESLQDVVDAIEKVPELGDQLLAKISPPKRDGLIASIKKRYSDDEVDALILELIQVERCGVSINAICKSTGIQWARVKPRVEELAKQERIMQHGGVWYLFRRKE
jgi:hypothetical protein